MCPWSLGMSTKIQKTSKRLWLNKTGRLRAEAASRCCSQTQRLHSLGGMFRSLGTTGDSLQTSLTTTPSQGDHSEAKIKSSNTSSGWTKRPPEWTYWVERILRSSLGELLDFQFWSLKDPRVCTAQSSRSTKCTTHALKILTWSPVLQRRSTSTHWCRAKTES